MALSRDQMLAMSSIFVSNTFASVAFGIFFPTIIYRLQILHTSGFITTLIVSVWALPMLIAGPLYTRIIARFKTKPCLLIGLSIAALAVASFPVFENAFAWLFLQLVVGSLFGHFYIVMESWLNAVADDSIRGRATALYGILPAIGYAVGGIVASCIPSGGATPFMAAAGAMALGLVPLNLLNPNFRIFRAGCERSMWSALRTAPLLLIVGLASGLFEGLPWGPLQVFGFRSGLSSHDVLLLLPAFAWGEILLTFPIGWLADRIGRRLVLVCAGVGTIACMCGFYLSVKTPVILTLVFVGGGIVNSIYALGLAILGQRFADRSYVSATAGFMMFYGIGTLAGAPAMGALIDGLGPQALPATVAATGAVVILVASLGANEWRAGRIDKAALSAVDLRVISRTSL
jgi:MFS family permease